MIVTSGGLLVNSVGLKCRDGGEMICSAKLSASLASIPSADNRRRHFPTQFTDALGDAEARPTLSNAISLPVCFKRKLRVPSLSTSLWLLLSCRPISLTQMIWKRKQLRMDLFHDNLLLICLPFRLCGQRQSRCLWGLFKLISDRFK